MGCGFCLSSESLAVIIELEIKERSDRRRMHMGKRYINTLVICLVLCLCVCSFGAANADQLTDALNEPAPFGIAHADDHSGLLVYKTANNRTKIDTLEDYQVCAILSTSNKNWIRVQYVSGNQLKDGYIQADSFYQLTVSGLATIMNDAASAAVITKLIQNTKANQFTAQAQATVAPTATPKKKATATPAAGRKRYVLNTKTMKFHLPSCSEVDKIANENKKTTTTTRESLINQGYDACQKCKP